LFPITLTPGNLPTITSIKVNAAGEIPWLDDDVVLLVDEQLIKADKNKQYDSIHLSVYWFMICLVTYSFHPNIIIWILLALERSSLFLVKFGRKILFNKANSLNTIIFIVNKNKYN
tara:strand:+ start:865 stop:1212 length:348 start_codon:yes stop_codon:yes gene_type:complete